MLHRLRNWQCRNFHRLGIPVHGYQQCMDCARNVPCRKRERERMNLYPETLPYHQKPEFVEWFGRWA